MYEQSLRKITTNFCLSAVHKYSRFMNTSFSNLKLNRKYVKIREIIYLDDYPDTEQKYAMKIRHSGSIFWAIQLIASPNSKSDVRKSNQIFTVASRLKMKLKVRFVTGSIYAKNRGAHGVLELD